MYLVIIFNILFALSSAAPYPQTNTTEPWKPAAGSVTTCDTTSDKIIGFYVGPQLETVLNDACAAMMPPCAYQDRLPQGTVCPRSIYWPLKGAKKSVQSANVETGAGNKISGWDVQFTVTPAPQQIDAPGVFWTKQECYGYFAHMLEKWEPEGCHTNRGFGIGKVKVGGKDSLKDAEFEVTIVPENQSE